MGVGKEVHSLEVILGQVAILFQDVAFSIQHLDIGEVVLDDLVHDWADVLVSGCVVGVVASSFERPSRLGTISIAGISGYAANNVPIGYVVTVLREVEPTKLVIVLVCQPAVASLHIAELLQWRVDCDERPDGVHLF